MLPRIRHFRKTALGILLVLPTLLYFLLQHVDNVKRDFTLDLPFNSLDDVKANNVPLQIIRLDNAHQTTAPRIAAVVPKKSPMVTRLVNQAKEDKKKILLFIAIHTAPIRIDRRNALRETWLTKCVGNPQVAYWFFTDNQDTHGNVIKGEIQEKLKSENQAFGDLILSDTPGGLNFGLWYLWMIEWATERYDFQFIVKLDDDYFVCFDKLINELQFHRPKKRLTWGWLHCRKEGNIYLDEAFILLTSDLIRSILARKDTTLLCHPFADQSIGLWMNSVPNLLTFADSNRLGDPRRLEKIKLQKGREICHTKLGIHKSYPDDMRHWWNTYLHEEKQVNPQVPPISYSCHLPIGINESKYGGPYTPKLCKDRPIWNFGEFFKGSQERLQKEEARSKVKKD